MKLISCHIDSFGKLKNVDINFDDNLSVFYQKNGSGKTTLSQFIKAMFYSLPAVSRKANQKSERTLYKPFDSEGKFGGRLVFSCEKGKFIVVRKFGNSPTLDEFALFDAKTNLVSKAFSQDLGEELFGVGRETFESSTFFGQQKLESGINDDIRASLSTGVLSGDDIDNFDKAQDKISKKLKEFRSELRSLNTEQMERNLRNLEMQQEEEKEELKKVNNQIEELNQQISLFESTTKVDENKNVSEFKNKEIALNALIEQDNNRLKESYEKKQLLENSKRFSEQDYYYLKTNKSQKPVNNFLTVAVMFFVLALIFAVSGIVCVFVLNNVVPTVILLIVGVICLVCGFLFYAKTKGDKTSFGEFQSVLKKYDLIQSQLEEVLHQQEKTMAEIKFVEEEIKQNLTSVEKNNFELSNLKKSFLQKFGCDLNDYEKNAFSSQNKISETEKNIVMLKTDKKHIISNIDKIEEKIFELNDSLQENKQKEHEIDQKMEVLNKVSMFLTYSRDNISNRYIEPVSEKFENYYKQFVQNGENIIIDTNLDLKFGDFKEVDYLSAGLLDLVYICKRFALVELIFKKEKPFIILDDPFANFDDEKLKTAKNIIEQLKLNYQIVLFTCQKNKI